LLIEKRVRRAAPAARLAGEPKANPGESEFGERRPPRSGGWQVSRRRSRVKTSSASGARRAAAAGG